MAMPGGGPGRTDERTGPGGAGGGTDSGRTGTLATGFATGVGAAAGLDTGGLGTTGALAAAAGAFVTTAGLATEALGFSRGLERGGKLRFPFDFAGEFEALAARAEGETAVATEPERAVRAMGDVARNGAGSGTIRSALSSMTQGLNTP